MRLIITLVVICGMQLVQGLEIQKVMYPKKLVESEGFVFRMQLSEASKDELGISFE